MEDTQKDVKCPRIVPRTITGNCSNRNKGALDWSPSGLLAYGCNYTVVVVDTIQLQIVQTLDKHKAPIIKIKWPSRIHTGISIHSSPVHNSESVINNHPLLLASGDTSGQIIIWDIISSVPLHILSDGNKPIQDLMWVTEFDHCEKYLIAVHPPYSIIVWDITTGTKLWKKTYTEQLLAMDIDPFNPSRLAFVSPECILLVEDFNLHKVPSSNGRKLYISSPKASTPVTPTVNVITDRQRDRLKKLMRDIIVGEAVPRPEEQPMNTLNDCLQLSFHKCLRHIICLVYSKEVLLVDLHIQHTVAVITVTERSLSSLQQLLICRQRDVLICVHESGNLSARLRRGGQQSEPIGVSDSSWNAPESEVELFYQHRCQTESIRLTKNHKVLAAAIHPVLESRAALLLSDGRLYFYDLCCEGGQQKSLAELMGPLWMKSDPAYLKFVISGLMLPLYNNPAVIRMCPALTVKNWQQYLPLMAVGCQNGILQVFNVATGVMKSEFSVHNYPIKGIEWINLQELLSYAQSGSSGNSVRNELSLTNVKTGKTTTVRPDHGEESPIEMVRVSQLKQYFIIIFKDSPLELWDLRRLTLIRTLSKRFPIVTALEWSPSHLHRHTRKSIVSEDSDSSVATLTAMSVKEFFVFADPDGNLYHLTVDGSVVKDGVRLSPPNSLNGIIAMAWKSEYMALGDAEGGVTLWEWRTRLFRPLPHSRSPIKKLRFAPGKNNMKLLILHMDGVDIWDVKEGERLGQWRTSPFRDLLTVLDADWSASERPILACSDGTLRVFDLTLHKSSSHISDYATEDPMLCLSLMPKPMFQSIRTGLQLDLKRSHVQGQQHDVIDFVMRNNHDCETIPERCLRAAQLCGDLFQCDLWNVASYYLRHSDQSECIPLDTAYDLLCDSNSYRQMAAERAALYQSKPRAYEHTRQLTRELLLLNDKDKAIALLLNTEPEHEHYYSNHLLACLAAILHPAGCHGNAHSTIKLVATHLIASGNVWPGIELLILNGQILDACRYLQSNSLWEDSARVAKLLLMNKSEEYAIEASDIWQRWAQYLLQNKQKAAATLVLTAIGAWHKAAEALLQLQLNDAAALLLRCAQLQGIYEPKDAVQQNFMEGLYCQYAQCLYTSGWQQAAKEWAELGGSKGQLLMDEWKFLNGDEE